MKMFKTILTLLICIGPLKATATEKIKGDLYSRKFSAHTHYVIDSEAGFIGVYTKARAFLMPINDTRTFNLDPENLISDVVREMEPGTKYSLDIKSESPRYEATIVKIDRDKNRATVAVKDRKRVIDLVLVLDLSGEHVNLKKASIKLLRVGGVTLNVKR